MTEKDCIRERKKDIDRAQNINNALEHLENVLDITQKSLFYDDAYMVKKTEGIYLSIISTHIQVHELSYF